MKFIGSWKYKYAGIETKKMTYYICWTYHECRHWGLEEGHYDIPLYRFGLWFIDFHWHWT